MTPEKKAAVEAKASHMGVSAGEYIRLAVDNYRMPDDEALRIAIVEQLAEALPAMQADLDAMQKDIAGANAAIDRALRATGARR